MKNEVMTETTVTVMAEKWAKIKEVVSRASRDIEDILEKQ
jgi:hypothetical protein